MSQDQKPKWAMHFNLDDDIWVKLSALAIKNKFSPLDIAIDLNIINQDQLLTWDRDASKIPTLKADFFKSEAPLELFQKFDYLKCREKACMPVTEWSGNIYWAKLSSDLTGFEKEGSQQLWFLTSWAGLKKWFTAWKALVPGISEQSPTIARFIEPPQSAEQNVVKPESVEGPQFVEQGFEFGEADPQESSHSKSFTGTELNVISLEKETPIAEPEKVASEQAYIEPPETVSLEMEIGKPLRPETSSQAINPEFGNINLAESMQPLKMEAPLPKGREKPPQKPLDAPVGLAKINKEVTSAIDFSSLLGAPIPPLPLQNKEKIEAPVIEAVEPIRVPIAPTKSLPTISLDQFESRLRLATTQDGLAEVFMGAWQNYFEQVMILLFKENTLNIWWHNFQFKSQITRGEVIPLDTPSAFKIVADTGHPYHGYVSPGPVNDKFFQIANGGSYPEHLTIMPVMSADRVVAMLLGMSTRDAAKGIVLLRLQEDARSFSNYLAHLSSAVKKVS